MIIPDNLRFSELVAFFTERHEGISGDFLSCVTDIPEKNFFFPIQRHTDKVILSGEIGRRVIADGLITEMRGVLLGVKVADCVPILIYDRKSKAIGAVHAGWSGTAKGISKRALALMRDKFSSQPEDIFIACGPSIRWCCYTVGEDVLKAVKEETGRGGYFFRRDGKICLDLASANKMQALSTRVPEKNIWLSEACTFCYPERFYSYRYSKTRGRQGGFIGMKPL